MNKLLEQSKLILSGFFAVFFLLLSIGSVSFAKSSAGPKKGSIKIVFNRALKEKYGEGGFAYTGIRKKYLIKDHVLASIETPPPASPWFKSEKAIYSNLMRNKKFDVLLVPFQTQLDGVDPIGRSLMSYRLAAEIERRTQLSVAYLPLVHFVLGSHARSFNDKDVYALAMKLDVSYIVWGFSGTHEDEKGHLQGLDITVAYQSKESFGSPEGSRCESWEKIDLEMNQLPSLIFETKLPEILSFLNFPKAINPQKSKSKKEQRPSIPNTPQKLIQTQLNDPIAKSYLYQFMGMLIPTDAEFHRQYMFIRSIVALLDADANHPDYAILKARAYHHLHRRPAALDALRGQNSERAILMKNMINGNLPDIDAVDHLLSPTMDGFLALVEYAWILDSYTNKEPERHVEQLINKYPEWRYFFEVILKDRDDWDVHSNIGLKQTLDRVYPIGDFKLKNLVKNRLSMLSGIKNDTLDLNMNMAFQEHLRKSLAELTDVSQYHTEGPNHLDHHIMFEGIGIANLIKRFDFLFTIQGMPEESLDLCKSYLKQYQGHPYFTLMNAIAQRKILKKQQGEEKSIAVNESVTNATLGLLWYGRQGWAYSYACNILNSKVAANSESIDKIAPYKPLLYGIASDYPLIPYCARTGFMRPYVDLIDWSTHSLKDLNTVVSIYSSDMEMLELVRRKSEGRFIGHPKRSKFELAVKSILHKGDKKSTEKKHYSQMIKQGSLNWRPYGNLGQIYAEEGNYKKALEIFLSYPGFAESAIQNRVGLSNMAYRAGFCLLLKGAYNEARPLLEYSANLNTGSGAGILSRSYIELIDRDFSAAAATLHRGAERYDQSVFYQDYISLLHILGNTEKAWQEFENLLGRYAFPHIWDSALIGHRLKKTSKFELKQWIKDMAELNQTSRQRSFPARFAFMCLIDREPDIKMAEFVSSVDDLSKYHFNNNRRFISPDGRPLGPEHFGRLHYTDSFTFDETKGFIIPKENHKELVKKYYEADIPKEAFSFYGSLALAYERLKERKYSIAYDILKKQSLLYSYELEYGKPVKPYLVWAGINSNNKDEIDKFMLGLLAQEGIKYSPIHRKASDIELPYDEQLSLATYQCAVGNHDDAIKRLKKCFANLPSSENRPLFSRYQLIELCEWFYEHCKDRRYLDLALKWSTDYQVFQPMYGWAFAFEAKHTKNKRDRLRALGYALHLDSQSWRIAHFSEAEKREAKEWFEANNQLKSHKL